jgi:hypothetical protein
MHNHPSGDPRPSRADVEMTRAIVDVARPLGIAGHDHLIVGKDGHASLEGDEVNPGALRLTARRAHPAAAPDVASIAIARAAVPSTATAAPQLSLSAPARV